MDKDIKIGKMTIGVCMTNTYFIYRDSTKEAIVVDPADKGAMIYDKLTKAGLTIKAVLLTHGHFDHIWGVEELVKLSGAKIYACEEERDFLTNLNKNLSGAYDRPCKVVADVYLKDGEVINECGMQIDLIHTPGHTEGGCCYYIKDAGFLISGDTLFQESVGRSDFPTGSMSTLVRSIKDKLLVLPDDTKVYPGHGAPTTIGEEKEYNPFL